MYYWLFCEETIHHYYSVYGIYVYVKLFYKPIRDNKFILFCSKG